MSNNKKMRAREVEEARLAKKVLEFCEHMASQKIDWKGKGHLFGKYLGFLDEEVAERRYAPRPFEADGVKYTPFVDIPYVSPAQELADVKSHFQTSRQRGVDPSAYEMPGYGKSKVTWTSEPEVPKEEMEAAILAEKERVERAHKEARDFNSTRWSRAEEACREWLQDNFPYSVALYGMTIVHASSTGSEKEFVKGFERIRWEIGQVLSRPKHPPMYKLGAFVLNAQQSGLWEVVKGLTGV